VRRVPYRAASAWPELPVRGQQLQAGAVWALTSRNPTPRIAPEHPGISSPPGITQSFLSHPARCKADNSGFLFRGSSSICGSGSSIANAVISNDRGTKCYGKMTLTWALHSGATRNNALRGSEGVACGGRRKWWHAITQVIILGSLEEGVYMLHKGFSWRCKRVGRDTQVDCEGG
jgi:hypothetical protein